MSTDRPSSPRLGVVFPTREFRRAPTEIVDYARGVEDLGYRHILVYDHVLGAAPAAHPGWTKYTNEDPFHEPFVLLGFLAGHCSLELVTGVVVLPQRQTALVAKQAAQLDWISGGRLRLGVGLGWNELEYQALGTEFRSRGRRLAEQIDVMRALWTTSHVTMESDDHTIPGLGIAPRPMQQPIPVWIGSGLGRLAVERAARVADGWMPLGSPGPAMDDALRRLRDAQTAHGRDPRRLGLEARVNCADGDTGRVADELAYWREREASHVSLSTMDAGYASATEHVAALERYAALLA